MGSLRQATAEPAITDLKVTIKDYSSLLPPPQETHNTKSMFLSNIDQVLNFHVQTVHFFQASPDFTPEEAALRLKKALQKVMTVHYDFLAGRLKVNDRTRRLEIECNASGIGFVEAKSEFSLDEIGDLVYPNPGFTQLIVPGLDKFDDQPLAVFQVTSFKCGGFALAASTSHVLFDGLGFKTFLENLASQAFDDGRALPYPPCNDRRLLAARSPPCVPFPHPELLQLKPSSEQQQQHHPTTTTVFDPTPENLTFKIFRLSPDDIQTLKDKAKPTSATTKITGFNAVAAHIWRCRALSQAREEEEEEGHHCRDRESVLLYVVDIRSRLHPPLPLHYSGNAVLNAYAAAKCSELEDGPFGRIVDLVSEGAARLDDEYARSVIDWGEMHEGIPNGEFLISSWWRLGFDEVAYPWGRARYSCPIVCHRKDIVLLFPEIGGGGGGNNGINVLIALPCKEMDKFEALFHKLLCC